MSRGLMGTCIVKALVVKDDLFMPSLCADGETVGFWILTARCRRDADSYLHGASAGYY